MTVFQSKNLIKVFLEIKIMEEKMKESLGKKSFGTETDTETWSWFRFPIPKPGFGRTLVQTDIAYEPFKYLSKIPR